eukprot:jgi/Hompol1/2389/HPOL_002922-RA
MEFVHLGLLRAPPTQGSDEQSYSEMAAALHALVDQGAAVVNNNSVSFALQQQQAPLHSSHSSNWAAVLPHLINEATMLPLLRFSHSTGSRSTQMRLGEILAQLPSPELSNGSSIALDNVDRGQLGRDDVQELLQRLYVDETVPGMRSRLYRYQRASVFKLLCRELAPETRPSPHYLPLHCTTPNVWFDLERGTPIQASVDQLPNTVDCRGGIICERMGSGKTVICLALIVLTLHHLSRPPCDPEFIHLSHSDPKDSLLSSTTAPRSLRSQACISLLRAGIHHRRLHNFIPEPVVDNLPLLRLVYERHPPVAKSHRGSNNLVAESVTTLLSSSTLVVVPDTLIDQWQSEISKHVLEGTLRYLAIVSHDMPIPPPEKLCEFDLVLISVTRFGLEYKHHRLSWSLGIRLQCSCPYIGSSRTRDCHCTKDPVISPLLRVRWLRLIVDEGHTMAKGGGKATLPVEMSMQIQCDRRWICSGTPFESIVGNVTEKVEKDDIIRLDILVSRFLACSPFNNTSGLFKRLYSLASDVNMRSCFLGYLLSNLTIRNALDRVEQEAIPSLITLNAVLTQREDKDYFFHKSNTHALRLAIGNTLASCSWFSGHTFISALEVAEKNLDEALACSGKYPAKDTALLHQIAVNGSLPFLLEGYSSDLEPIVGALTSEAFSMPGSLLQAVPFKTIDILRKHATKNGPHELFSSTALSRCSIVGTLSAKWTYVLEQLVKFKALGEKTLVYAQNEDDIRYLHEICMAARIRCLLFHRQGMSVSERAKNVVTFNTGDIDVMAMYTQISAWGINLPTATRIIFLTPVWRSDMELQAINRAHRIGSTRPVFVETLVIRDTIEETISDRKQEIETGSSKLVADVRMRELIENVRPLGLFGPDNAAQPIRHTLSQSIPVSDLHSQQKYHDFYQDTLEPVSAIDQPGEPRAKRVRFA